MATLDELVVRIKADASQLDRELRRVNGTVRQSSSQMGASLGALRGQFAALLPALTVATVVAFGKAAVDATGRIKDLSQQIGFAAATVAGLERPLAGTGATLDQFAASVNLMNANIGGAAAGNQEMIKTFDALGLSVSKLTQMSPEEQFYEITAALAGVNEQFKQTDLGRAVFGRGFAALIPLINESNGNLRAVAETSRDLGTALGEDTIQRVDAFGDALEAAAHRARNEFLELLAAVLKVSDLVADSFGAGSPGALAAARTGTPLPGPAQDAYATRAQAGGFVTAATRVSGYGFDANGNLVKAPSGGAARGSNAGLLKRSATGGSGSENPSLPDYDEGKFTKYLRDLQDEADALGQSERSLAIRKALTEAQEAAQKDYADGLRDTALLYDAEKEKIEALAGSYHDLKEQIDENRETAREWEKQLSDGLTDLILNFDNAKDAAKGFFNEIARQIINKQITGPLSNGIMGLLGGSGGGLLSGILGGGSLSQSFGFATSGGYGPFPGFADGGSPPVGAPSIVGERGPEIFVPKTAGTVVPNHALGGRSVNISNSWSIGSGVTRQELANMIPLIEARTRASVFAAIERGGREASLVNRKN